MANAREDYGIDAPTVVRNLAVAGVLLLVVSLGTAALLHLQLIGPTRLARILRNNGFVTAIVCLIMAFWMIASSKWLKQRIARALLDARAWRGDEAVLDIGCGRGLVAIAAARRLPRGRVAGVAT